MIQIPVLHTKRLTLRPMTFADWPAYSACLQTEHVRYMGGPFSVATAWGLFCADYAHWGLFGFGGLMIEDRRTRCCLGQVAISSGPIFPEQELGWLVFPEAEGQGVAFEAAKELRNWARNDCSLPTLVSYVDPANFRSRRLAERLGAIQDENAKKQDETDIVYRHF